MRKATNKLVVIICQTEELLQILQSLWNRPSSNSFSLSRINTNLTLAYDMTQVLQRETGKLTLLQLCKPVMVAQLCQNLAHMVNVLFSCL